MEVVVFQIYRIKWMLKKLNKKYTKTIIDNQLYFFINGKLIYKRWLLTGQSFVFDLISYDKRTLKSIKS